MKVKTKRALDIAVQYCIENDKSFEFATQYLQDVCDVDFECATNYLIKILMGNYITFFILVIFFILVYYKPND